jgi:hypothetical protein
MRKFGSVQIRAGAVAVVLAGTGLTGMAGASASVTPETVVNSYQCTSQVPELCFGVEHNGSDVISANIQAKIGDTATYYLEIVDPHGNGKTWGPFKGADQWSPPETWSENMTGRWCGYLEGTESNGSGISVGLCVTV